MNFFCPYSKIFNNQWSLSRFCAILVIKNWRSSDPDPKLIITDPDPANNFGSDRIRIPNTGYGTYQGTGTYLHMSSLDMQKLTSNDGMNGQEIHQTKVGLS